MIFKNDNVGLALGVFIGSALGSVGTLFVLKKLKKLEEKSLQEYEAAHVEEIKKYYEDKITKIKSGTVINIPNCIETAEKVVNEIPKVTPIHEAPQRIKYDSLHVDDAEEVKPGYDYSKISRSKYTDLQKEYEREEIQEDADEIPHQITKANYENSTGYQKLELMYYEQNGIFTYMDDSICNNVNEEIIGAENLALFGTDDASIDGMSGMYDLYLRSNKIMTDFHLIYNGTEDYNKVIGANNPD